MAGAPHQTWAARFSQSRGRGGNLADAARAAAVAAVSVYLAGVALGRDEAIVVGRWIAKVLFVDACDAQQRDRQKRTVVLQGKGHCGRDLNHL